MKINKKTYLQPNTTVLSIENVGMICGSSVKCVDAYHAMHIALM